MGLRVLTPRALNCLNFQSLEVVSRYRNTQLQGKIHVICEIWVPYISVSRLKAYFTFNNWLLGVIQVLPKRRLTTVVDISAPRVNSIRVNVPGIDGCWTWPVCSSCKVVRYSARGCVHQHGRFTKHTSNGVAPHDKIKNTVWRENSCILRIRIYDLV